MIKIILFAVSIVAIIENVNCWKWKSTYCPNAEPMAGFQWGPVINTYYYS